MRVSYSWLSDYVDGLDVAPESLERLITMKTAECEGVEHVGELLAEASLADVLEVEPIPDGHNVKARVGTVRYGEKTVVCGAPNCRVGLTTVFVPLGKKVIQGVESDGMLASGSELGINRDHSGVIEFRTSLIEDLLLGVDLPRPDAILEIDNKSLTHRPDLWGHFGMAREISAITGKRLIDPVKAALIPSDVSPVHVEIEDMDLCPRYSALVFDNVTIGPSPLWLQYRLTAIGLNPINNIVDLTNYVMAELAQPMHAFDRAKLRGTAIFARPARPGERIIALNDIAYDLTPSNLVIADEGGPIAIAGVIGGAESAISDATTSIVLESANFQASSVRKTSSALKLRTDASMRFEKSQDPANTTRGLARAAELLRELSPGIRLVGGLADAARPVLPIPPVTLDLDWLALKLGRSLEAAEVRAILEALEFEVELTGPRVFSVRIPSWRATKDIAMAEDLVEEVGRMIGYDSIPPKPPLIAAMAPPEDPRRMFVRQMKTAIALQGFTEVSNYSFVSEEQVQRFGMHPEDHVRVLNPIAADQSLLRRSLLSGIFSNLEENSKHFTSFRLFEIGNEIHKREGELPEQIMHLVAAVFNREGDGAAGLFELKRLAEILAPGVDVQATEALPYEHPARSAEVSWNGEIIGRLFELHPALAKRAAILDLNLDRVLELRPARAKYQAVRRFPSSAFDLSVVTALREPAGRVLSTLRSSGGVLLLNIEFLRQYSGPPLAEGTQTLTFRITVGAADRTLLVDEVAGVRSQLTDGLNEKGYGLRG
jgi:phenylalanyl-tRNA synthetase beta chain